MCCWQVRKNRFWEAFSHAESCCSYIAHLKVIMHSFFWHRKGKGTAKARQFRLNSSDSHAEWKSFGEVFVETYQRSCTSRGRWAYVSLKCLRLRESRQHSPSALALQPCWRGFLFLLILDTYMGHNKEKVYDWCDMWNWPIKPFKKKEEDRVAFVLDFFFSTRMDVLVWAI